MPEQVSNLRERNTTLDEPGRIFVPEVMPAQPRDSSRLESRQPSLAEVKDRLAGRVAEDDRCLWLVFTVCIDPLEVEHAFQPDRPNRHQTRLPALRGAAPQHDQLPIPVDVAESERQHFPFPHAGVERRDNHRPEIIGRRGQQSRLFVG
ncbi:MAG TPA: hypothetical protein VNE16_05055 [Vicinamibacterales bacterium]|nr:hypothetical protein [Vicinamibacterales bacterium]